ncbi:MAG: DUF2752 domain-containing protein [Lachnospiraceae bacterium]
MDEQMGNINYPVLTRDYIIINVVSAGALFVMGIYIILQQIDVIPTIPCMMHDLLHIYCPGCGGTRAAFALLHGHIIKSICYNPILLIGLILIVYYECGVLLTIIKKNGKKYYIANAWPVYVYLIFVFVYAIFRDVMLLGFQIDMLHDFLP